MTGALRTRMGAEVLAGGVGWRGVWTVGGACCDPAAGRRAAEGERRGQRWRSEAVADAIACYVCPDARLSLELLGFLCGWPMS